MSSKQKHKNFNNLIFLSTIITIRKIFILKKEAILLEYNNDLAKYK